MKAILTYHSIDDSGSPISVSPRAFERHVAWLGSDAVQVVPLEELARVPEDQDAIALTFDDGFENFSSFAWPRLRDSGLPATVFVVTDRVGSDNRWGGRSEPGIPELPLMDWDAIGRASDQGAAIGAHSATHAVLPACGDAALEAEIVGCREVIERRLGIRPTTFCYPYGAHDDRVVDAVKAAFELACTVELSLVRPVDTAWRLPRLDAFYLQGEGRLETFGSRPFARWIACRALLRSFRERARRMLGRGPV